MSEQDERAARAAEGDDTEGHSFAAFDTDDTEGHFFAAKGDTPATGEDDGDDTEGHMAI